jgi:hypothetical protein
MKWMAFILLLLLLAGQVIAASYFKVIDVSPIHVYPNAQANFTVTLKSMGGSGAFAQPIFKTTEGLSASVAGGLKHIVATGSRRYNCTMQAENITPGNYSFQVGVNAQSAPYSWRTAYITVEAPVKSIEASVNKSQNANESAIPQSAEAGTGAGKIDPKGIPGPGFVLTLSALIIAARKART